MPLSAIQGNLQLNLQPAELQAALNGRLFHCQLFPRIDTTSMALWADLLKTFAAAGAGSVATYLLTRKKERKSSAAARKRECLEFLIIWKAEFSDTYFDGAGPPVRNSEAFHEQKATFLAIAESMSGDFSGVLQERFNSLREAIASIERRGYSKDGHQRAVKAVDEMIAFLRKS